MPAGPDASPAAPFLGELNKRFKVRRLLGSGGMSIVLEAHDEALARDVAIKLVRCGSGAETRARRLLREAKTVARLRSRHVARVLDWGWLNEREPFIVMELLNGRDLGSVLRADGPLPLARALRYMVDACDALVEAHAAGIIHRDVKPSNLFVVSEATSEELLKVLDFGIAKELNADAGSANLTHGAHLLGTPRYMAPEQLAGGSHLDERVDVWSTAVTLYELATGRTPFEGKEKAALWHAIVSEVPRRLRQDLAHAPRELETLLLQCLEKRPEARLPNLKCFGAELVRLLDRVAGSAFEDTSPVAPRRSGSGKTESTFTPSTTVLPSRSKVEPALGQPRPRRRTRRLLFACAACGVLAASVYAIVPSASLGAAVSGSGSEPKQTLVARHADARPKAPVPEEQRAFENPLESVKLAERVSEPLPSRPRTPPVRAQHTRAEPTSEPAREVVVPTPETRLERALSTRR